MALPKESKDNQPFANACRGLPVKSSSCQLENSNPPETAHSPAAADCSKTLSSDSSSRIVRASFMIESSVL